MEPATPARDAAAISGAEMKVWLDWLGLRQRDAARLWGVNERTVRAWIGVRSSVPEWVGDRLEELDQRTAGEVDRLVQNLQDMRDPSVTIYRTDAEMWAARPDTEPLPESWWRMVVARATVEVPGVEIDYAG